MQIRLLLGPAGSGKTFRCLAEVRQALKASPEGPPLLLLAPKQTSYALERQLLSDPQLPGYTRLQIVSFERLASFILQRLAGAIPELLDEEGRLMVLRSLLTSKRGDLKLFRASARLTGFAGQLSQVFHELQQHGLTPDRLEQLAAQAGPDGGLSYKLQDFAVLLREYLAWLASHNLQDADVLLASAVRALEKAVPAGASGERGRHLEVGGLWVDGFAEFAEQELALLAAIMPYCKAATLAFCIDHLPTGTGSWLSNWSTVRHTFTKCEKVLLATTGAELRVELLRRGSEQGRFSKSTTLQHLEAHWAEPQATGSAPDVSPELDGSLRVAICGSPEIEVALGAREILRHVRTGGRYREVAVLVRKLEGYHHVVERVLTRYEIPFFLDRRESVAHHPLAELTRNALRTVAFGWQPDDWFAALKTGLVAANETEIDRLENEALARGWRGAAWHQPLVAQGDTELTRWALNVQQRLMPPFEKLALAMAANGNRPTGTQLAEALRAFWSALEIEQRLQAWADEASSRSPLQSPGMVHETVWGQMNAWLDNVQLAFPVEAVALRDWLPILEAGLANLSVGVIPPALDQVLIGSIDRSRTPEVKLALVLGLNESVFPAPAENSVLLTDTEREQLEKHSLDLGGTARRQLARERYYAYIACTRPQERLVLTCAMRDEHGATLNPSPFLSHIRRLFPALPVETVTHGLDWSESEHPHELLGPLLRLQAESHPHEVSQNNSWKGLLELPCLATVVEAVRHFHNPQSEQLAMPSALASRLYGPVLRTSVSRLEQFAACPFRFFVHSGLRAQERKKFELDVREQGTFQHDALALYHEQLREENKRWRDISPAEARKRIGAIASALQKRFREGLLETTEQTRFAARVMTESLQDFVETLTEWMRGQYLFDPAEVELPFGEDQAPLTWSVEVGAKQRLELYGRIDRVDLYREPKSDEALCVVLDYKSSQKQLDTVLIWHGVQLQLLTYLNVLRRCPSPREVFGVNTVRPAGVFYASLRGKYDRESNRTDALADPNEARRYAYRHTGRFDSVALPFLDSRPGAVAGDQFNYRRNKSGAIHGACREVLSSADFGALLDHVELQIQNMGRRIYAGVAEMSPYRKGTMTACDQCEYHAICRIDPWTHRFRMLRKEESGDSGN